MLSVSKGYSITYLTDEVAQGREGYYTKAVAAGEPPGVWYGAGAELLGLHGEVDPEVMEAVYLHNLNPSDPNAADRSTWGQAAHLGAPARKFRTAEERFADLLAAEPHAGPERRAEMWARAEQHARQPVAFFDTTFSPQKSVTVLAVAAERAENTARERAERADASGRAEQAQAARAEQAAWAEYRATIERAVMAGARASVDYLQDKAGYGKVGHHGGGAGRWIDAHKFVVAQFLQHDSRDRDPQLHVHQAILNRQLCADGVWRALDGRAIYAARPAAAAHGERVMEAQLERDLGIEFRTRPDGKAREIVGVDQRVMDLFSSRRQRISAAVQQAVLDFREATGREPSALELTRISQEATLRTRKGKSHDGETNEARSQRWAREARVALEGGLGRVLNRVLAAGRQERQPARWSASVVVDRAVAELEGKQATWSRPDLVRAVSDALPGNLGLSPQATEDLIERLADYAVERVVVTRPAESTAGLPDEFRLADGRSAYQEPSGERYASPRQIAAEQALAEAGRWRSAPALTADEAAAVVARYAENGHELGADQAAAVRGVLSSGISVEVLQAAAGAGKSFTVGVVADAWSMGRTIGLAPSQVAAQVLADEGVQAWNLAAWQDAHARVAAGRGRPGDAEMQPRPGDLVVVDEAGMASTMDLAAVVERCGRVGAKVLLVGDPRQLAAVGPGGALADVHRHGGSYELTEVRRFHSAWEGEASLRIRDADASALTEYDKHGRVRAGGTPEEAEEAAARAWLADTLNGKDSLLIVGTNAAAERASASLRAQLVRLGRVHEEGVLLGRDKNVGGVGDRVQARRNGWELQGVDGNTRVPINRDTYTVTGVGEDGSMTVTDTAGVEIRLPAQYVSKDLALAYATTVHGAQGRTVDTAHGVVAPGEQAGSVYVQLTRGREGNTLWVVTRQLPEKSDTGEAQDIEERSARAVVGDIMANAEEERGALAQQAEAQALQESAFTSIDRLADGVQVVTAGRVSGLLDGLVAAGSLSEQDREALAADSAMGAVGRLLRGAEVAGRDPGTVLREVLDGAPLTGSRSPGQVLFARVKAAVGDTATSIGSVHDLLPSGLPEGPRRYLEGYADAADTRRHELGAQTAADPPEWAIRHLGQVPEDPLERADWEVRAGWVALWRENQQLDERDTTISDAGPLGAAPPAGLAEKRALWTAAHVALGGPDARPDEANMSDGQLLNRVEAYERERAWAPAWVAEQLAATAEAASDARTDATVWAAHGEGEHAESAAAQAEELEQIRGDLSEVDAARGRWWAHTAETRDKAERARSMLTVRGVDPDVGRDRVTAEEWMTDHQAAMRDDARSRPITEDDVTTDTPVEDTAAVQGQPETGRTDIRENARTDESELSHPAREVPDRSVAAVGVMRAREALDELADRHSLEAAHGDDAEEVPWWVDAAEDTDPAWTQPDEHVDA